MTHTGGGVTKKGWIRRGVKQKRQCTTYTHTAYVGWRTGPPQAPPHCAACTLSEMSNLFCVAYVWRRTLQNNAYNRQGAFIKNTWQVKIGTTF
jgi:hypothetical protein